MGGFPQIGDLGTCKLSLKLLNTHPNTKGFWWCWVKQVQSDLGKFELEYKRRDGKVVSGNFYIHNPVTFQELAKVCVSVIRSFIWTHLRENLPWNSVQLLPLVSWEISVQDFRPVLYPYPSFTSLVFCTPHEAQMGAKEMSQMFILIP